MNEICESEDRLTLIVAHGGTIVNIVAWWLKLEEEDLSYVTFHTSPASLSVLTVTPLKERSIERLNDASHMQEIGHIPSLPIDREPNTN
jgi:broad specificity phosphatase PhoE